VCERRALKKRVGQKKKGEVEPRRDTFALKTGKKGILGTVLAWGHPNLLAIGLDPERKKRKGAAEAVMELSFAKTKRMRLAKDLRAKERGSGTPSTSRSDPGASPIWREKRGFVRNMVLF